MKDSPLQKTKKNSPSIYRMQCKQASTEKEVPIMCAASEALALRVGENNNGSLVGPLIGDGEAPQFVPGATSGNNGSRTSSKGLPK